jgi:hypothetical protein
MLARRAGRADQLAIGPIPLLIVTFTVLFT